ncbi:MAG: hypothetical protein JSV90_00875 [Methanobacteriota archaeon]|nr:MAG: hypothetical protein JSV90_00875 [Euryarchaeota archaeon]
MTEGRKAVSRKSARKGARLPASVMVFLLVSSMMIVVEMPAAEVSAESVPSHERLFRMHVGEIGGASDYDWLNSSEPNENPTLDYDGDTFLGITIRKSLPSNRWQHFWVLYPELTSDVQILGNISTHVWAASRDNESTSMITVEFSDMNPADWDDPDAWVLIGSTTVPLAGPVYSSFKPYDIVVTGVDYVLPAGHQFVLTIMQEGAPATNDGLLVLYDDDYFDSYVLFDTPDFVSVDELTFTDTLGTVRTTFSDSEDIVITANVSNPYGVYEIMGSEVQIAYSGNSTVVLAFAQMQLIEEDASPNPSWRVYEYIVSGLPEAELTVTVRASDPQGSPSWLSGQIEIVTVDHFGLVVPTVVTVHEEFGITVRALNESGGVQTDWVGPVQLEAYLTDNSTPATGALGVASLMIDVVDSGEKMIFNQTLDYSEETIVIRASCGPNVGWSLPIEVRSGPAVTVNITSEDPPEVAAGWSVAMSVVGLDANGFVNSTWVPNWTVTGDIGTLIADGFTATLDAVFVGTGTVTCRNDATGAWDSLVVTVDPGLLTTIITNPDDSFMIREGQTTSLSATGYDLYGNEVDISSAIWSTNTSGMISGVGDTASYTAGFIPEVGVVQVSVGSVFATLWVCVDPPLQGPWLTPIPMQTKTEDSNWTFSLSTYWHHNEGTSGLRWFVEDVNTSLYLVVHDPTSEAIMRFLTQPDKSGTDQFKLWVRDESGYSDYEYVTVWITAVNDRPMFINEPPTELYVKFETPYSFDYSYYVKDVDTPKTDLRMVSSLPSNVYFDWLIGTFLFPEQDGHDSYFEIMTLTVTDAPEASSPSSADSDTLNIVVRVTDDTPPSLNQSLPEIVIEEGDENVFVFDLDDYFFDLDDDYLVYTRDFDNILISIDEETHEVYVSATTEWSGVTEGTFTAIDPTGALKTDTVRVTVIAVNDPPQFKSPGSVHVRYNHTSYLDASIYISDPDHALEELSVGFSTPYVTYTNGQLVFLFPPSESGGPFTEPYVVQVYGNVSDPNGACAPCMFEVLVSDNYAPEVRTPNPYCDFVSFLEDGYLNNSMHLDTLFFDFDHSGEDLSYTASGNLNVVVQIFPDSTVNFSALENWSGSEMIDFRAVDPLGAWCSWQVTVTVIAVNDAPVAYPIPDYYIRSGEGGTHIDISGYFIDSEAAFSGLLIHAFPDPEAIVVGNYLYIDFPQGARSIKVTLRATDSEGAESNAVTFTVHLVENWADKIGWPWTFLITIMGAGIGGYLLARRIPRPFELEDLFLIHNDGRLISHVLKGEEQNGIDKDVVSAMFTAVQEFVRDSFQAGEVGLKKLEIGDENVMIEKGESVYLALIYSGWPPKDVFQRLSMLLSDIEERYSSRVERWNGTKKALPGVDEMLQNYMARAYEPGAWQPEEEGIKEEDWVDIISKDS